jgi:hypothetical protein
VQERDAALDEYARAFRAAVAATTARFDAALAEVDRWESAWTLRVGALRTTNSASGVAAAELDATLRAAEAVEAEAHEAALESRGGTPAGSVVRPASVANTKH